MTFTAAARALLSINFLIITSSCGIFSECEDKILVQSVNRSGDRTAVAFVRSCGATTGESLHISIVEGSKLGLVDKGKIMILDDPKGLITKEDLTWINNREIEIKIPASNGTFLRRNSQSGVNISYW